MDLVYLKESNYAGNGSEIMLDLKMVKRAVFSTEEK